jgi:hypothetical protein
MSLSGTGFVESGTLDRGMVLRFEPASGMSPMGSSGRRWLKRAPAGVALTLPHPLAQRLRVVPGFGATTCSAAHSDG